MNTLKLLAKANNAILNETKDTVTVTLEYREGSKSFKGDTRHVDALNYIMFN